MSEVKLEISPTCELVCYKYQKYLAEDHTEVTLDYIEHSTDHWHSDNETSLDIGKEKALEIIDFLRESYGL